MTRLEILHCDNHVIALAKPAGIPCVPDDSGDESLLDHARHWIEVEYQKPGKAFLGVVHRLDRPVSGVVVFGRTSKGAKRLTEQFRTRNAKKTYWGVVGCELDEEEGLLVQWLEKDSRANRVTAYSNEREGAREARTAWRVLKRKPTKTLVEFRPETGRPHQLRLAARTLGAPLLGDVKYGSDRPLKDRSIALHARRLQVAHPTQDEPLDLECAPPRAPWWSW